MSDFFITPYVPPDDITQWDAIRQSSDLRIDPSSYKAHLLQTWPYAEFFSTSDSIPLEWSFYTKDATGKKIPRGLGWLDEDRQIVSTNTPYEEFFLWHRSVIAPRHRLYLFHGGDSCRRLELKPDTTIEEVEDFLGRM